MSNMQPLDLTSLNSALADADSEKKGVVGNEGQGLGSQVGQQVGGEVGDTGARAAADAFAPGLGSAPVVGDAIGKVGRQVGERVGGELGGSLDNQLGGADQDNKPSSKPKPDGSGNNKELEEMMRGAFDIGFNFVNKVADAGSAFAQAAMGNAGTASVNGESATASMAGFDQSFAGASAQIAKSATPEPAAEASSGPAMPKLGMGRR